MAELTITDLRQGYQTLIEMVLNHGEKAAPRGQATREILGFTLRVEDVTNNLLTGVRKGYNPAIGAVEAAQLIGGVSDPALTVRVGKNFGNFLDAGIFHGAYGPRIKTQLPEVVSQLAESSESRQAIVQIWRPQDDLWGSAKDLPCTLGFQFFVRAGRLVMVTRMRSNDVMWGVPYDVFQFTQLQLTLCNVLDLMPGEYIHQVGSMHIYERDLQSLLQVETNTEVLDGPLGFGTDGLALSGEHAFYMGRAMGRARSVLGVTGEGFTHDAETAWYAKTLEKYYGME